MVMGEQTLATQVAVIGGGPDGYAAAFRAADLRLDVTLIDAEPQLGAFAYYGDVFPPRRCCRWPKSYRRRRRQTPGN
jgi:dihydrolipoamide dehydrogenase